MTTTNQVTSQEVARNAREVARHAPMADAEIDAEAVFDCLCHTFAFLLNAGTIREGQAMADALFTAVVRFHVMAEQQAAGW